jgi:hypothetical protein
LLRLIWFLIVVCLPLALGFAWRNRRFGASCAGRLSNHPDLNSDGGDIRSPLGWVDPGCEMAGFADDPRMKGTAELKRAFVLCLRVAVDNQIRRD